MRGPRGAAFVVLVLFLACGAAKSRVAFPPSDSLEGLSWLAGHWGAKDETGTTEEGWFAPRGTGLIVGVHRDISPEGRVAFENLRIESRPSGVFLVAGPMGRRGTAFRMVERAGRRAVFENLRHGFPRRITYRREGDALFATAEGVVRGEPRKVCWAWRLMP